MKFLFTSLFFSLAATTNTITTAVYAAPNFHKVLTIVLENTSYEKALQQGFLSSLAKKGSYTTSFMASAHPSQPNYIAMIAGSTLGVTNDGNYQLDESHIGDLLEEKGLDWRVYAEDYPGNCYTQPRAGKYAKKHVPFLSFNNVTSNPNRCQKVTDAKSFKQDLLSNKLPAYTLYIPNLDNDGHDSGITFADNWLNQFLNQFINSPNYPKDLLLIITFDEGSYIGFNKILTIFYGPMIKPGFTFNLKVDRLNLLKTMEVNWELRSLNHGEELVAPITQIFN